MSDIDVEANWFLLCDLVHEMCGDIAAAVNNSGEQIDWLLSQGMTEEAIQNWLDDCNGD